jgi:hypothetical protein
MLGQTYNAPAVPWLRNITSQGSDLGQVVGRPGVLNLQHLLSTDSKAGQSPHRSVTTAATNANSQVLRKGLHSLNPKPINPEVHSQSLEWSWSWIPYVYATLITIIHLYMCLSFENVSVIASLFSEMDYEWMKILFVDPVLTVGCIVCRTLMLRCFQLVTRTFYHCRHHLEI